MWCHRACVAPAAAVPVEAAGAPGDAGGGRQGPALPVIEGHVIHGEVAASPGSTPDTLDNHLRDKCHYNDDDPDHDILTWKLVSVVTWAWPKCQLGP